MDDERLRLWYRFEKSGAPADYLQYCKAKALQQGADSGISPPSVDTSIDGITELPES